jgi:glycosyltransferase involved in cell wall biosynthesis
MNEIVIPNETGFLVPVDDPAAMSEKLILLLQNPELQKQMRCRTRRLVNENLSVHQMTRAFEQLMAISR